MINSKKKKEKKRIRFFLARNDACIISLPKKRSEEERDKEKGIRIRRVEEARR